MGKKARDYQRRQLDQCANDLDRFIYNLHIMVERYNESLAEYEVKRQQPGGEFLEKYRPNYDKQIAICGELTILALNLQDLTEQFKKSYV